MVWVAWACHALQLHFISQCVAVSEWNGLLTGWWTGSVLWLYIGWLTNVSLNLVVCLAVFLSVYSHLYKVWIFLLPFGVSCFSLGRKLSRASRLQSSEKELTLKGNKTIHSTWQSPEIIVMLCTTCGISWTCMLFQSYQWPEMLSSPLLFRHLLLPIQVQGSVFSHIIALWRCGVF